MGRLRTYWGSLFDVRPGEYLRTICMTLYLMLVLFAYYILKPVSRGIFLAKFDIDKLPWLYVLIAAVGGVLAYFYTKLAVKSSLKNAVSAATIFSIAVLVGFWWAIPYNFGWIVYAFNIWVSLFSVTLVAQGWLIAANIFTPREAKRLYGILGVGSVIGAAFGGDFTAFTVRIIGTTNLILASAAMVVLSYIPFYVMVRKLNVALKTARAADEGEQQFNFGEIVSALRKHRHLQVIMAIMVITFIIDVMVEFQFNAEAKIAYRNKTDLTAFLGTFYGLWLNLLTFVCQFFLTTWVVSRFGVGGTLQIMPITIAAASVAALVSPTVLSTGAARLAEASTRYSFNKTGMELLYLPLPLELRNRTKAFVDVFVDRMSRGIGGMILVLVTSVLGLATNHVAAIVMAFAAAWIVLSVFAKREYITTVRRRIETRRLDFESARVRVNDPATVALLEDVAAHGTPRQASYALRLLTAADSHGHLPLQDLVRSNSSEVRAAAFSLARARSLPDFYEDAEAELRTARPDDPAAPEAVQYLLAFANDRPALAARLIEHPNPAVAESAVKTLATEPAGELFTPQWLAQASASDDAHRRALAAIALRAAPDNDVVLAALLRDHDPRVSAAALETAGALGRREDVPAILEKLPDAHVRGAAIEALAQFGPRITGTLGDVLDDPGVPLKVRVQIPRVLRLIRDQRSVDTLLRDLGHPNLAIRGAVLRALNRLRESAPNLNYGAVPVTDQVLNEARYYSEMNASLAAFREYRKPHTPAGLLVATLEERLKASLERLFRVLGLRYPPKQVYAAWLALERGDHDEATAALEFLDNLLDRDLKRIVVPLLEDPGQGGRTARALFNIAARDPETAIRELIRCGDEWLAACAVATAAQLRLRGLAQEISGLCENAQGDVSQVARDTLAALA